MIELISESDVSKLTDLIMNINLREDEISPIPLTPLRDAFNRLESKHLFDDLLLSSDSIPTKSILIKSEKRNIGKTLLLQSWIELLRIESDKIVRDKNSYYDEEKNCISSDYFTALKKYSYRFLCERDISAHYSDFQNSNYDFDFDFNYVPTYFFLDDFCYENTYNFNSGKVTDKNFINFMRKLLEYLCNNRDKIIVIATTNNSPKRILSSESDYKKSSIYTRYEEIFRVDGKFNGVEIK